MNGWLRTTEHGLDMKTIKLEIDDEIADAIVVASIKESLDCLDEHISDLKGKKKLEKYEIEDLGEAVLDFTALKRAHFYYGGKEYVGNRKKVRK